MQHECGQINMANRGNRYKAMQLRIGTYYPCSRPVFTGRRHSPSTCISVILDTPCWQVVFMGGHSYRSWARLGVHVLTARVYALYGPWTRSVQTGRVKKSFVLQCSLPRLLVVMILCPLPGRHFGHPYWRARRRFRWCPWTRIHGRPSFTNSVDRRPSIPHVNTGSVYWP